MQLIAHFARFPWRVPLFCLPIAILGAVLEIAYLFDSLGILVKAILFVLGLLLLLGLIGYVVAIRSLAKNKDASGVEVFFMVILSIAHLIGTGWYWFFCLAMLDSLPH